MPTCRTFQPPVFAQAFPVATKARPQNPNQLVGDSDRERTAARLGRGLTEGYLAMPEYEARLGRAFDATTVGELRDLTGDLPSHILRYDPKRAEAHARAARLGVKLHIAAYVAMVVIVLTVWLAVAVFSGPTYFWPVWPILGGLIGVISHATPVRMALRRRITMS